LTAVEQFSFSNFGSPKLLIATNRKQFPSLVNIDLGTVEQQLE